MSEEKAYFYKVKEFFISYDPVGLIGKTKSKSAYDKISLKVSNKLSDFKSFEEVREFLGLEIYEFFGELDAEASDLAHAIYNWWDSSKIIRSSFDIMDPDIQVGKTYEHYKGQLYRVHSIVKHSETLEDLVLYECLYDNKLSKIWVRPKENFLSFVEIEGESVPRFKVID